MNKYFILLASVGFVGCGSDGGDGCVPGERSACLQDNGGSGLQICDDTGGFGECLAFSGDDGGSVPAPGTAGIGFAPSNGSTGGVAVVPAVNGTQRDDGGGASSPPAAPDLRTALSNQRFEFDSAESGGSIIRERYSTLTLCGSGGFALRQVHYGSVPGTGSDNAETSYLGAWTLTRSNGLDVLRLAILEPAQDAETLQFPFALSGGDIFIDDGTGFSSSSAREPAVVSDATAECGSAATPPPSTPGTTPQPSAPPGVACAAIPAPASACEQCLTASCCAELTACVPGTACGNIAACAQLCPALDDACVLSQCPAGLEAGIDSLNALAVCNDGACAAECGSGL